MVLQTPKPLWACDTVYTDGPNVDPMFSALTGETIMKTAYVIAMPAPGYCIAFGSNYGECGFMEFAFAPVASSADGRWEITNLKWTDAIMASDFQPWSGSTTDYVGWGAPHASVFPATRDILIVSPTDPYNVSVAGVFTRRFSYGTTFGSLAPVTGVGLHKAINDFNKPTVTASAINPSQFVMRIEYFAQAGEGPYGAGKPARYVTLFAQGNAGGIDNDIMTTCQWVEPTHLNPALTGYADRAHVFGARWIDESHLLLLAVGATQAQGISGGNYYTSYYTAGTNIAGWTDRGDSQTIDWRLEGAETLDKTSPSRVIVSTVDDASGPPGNVVDGAWLTTIPSLEAQGTFGSGLGATDDLFQYVGNGVIERTDHPSTYSWIQRTWNADTGENLEAWYAPANLRRAQMEGIEVWLRWYGGSGTGYFLLYIEPEPEPVAEIGPPVDACFEDPDVQIPATDVVSWRRGGIAIQSVSLNAGTFPVTLPNTFFLQVESLGMAIVHGSAAAMAGLTFANWTEIASATDVTGVVYKLFAGIMTTAVYNSSIGRYQVNITKPAGQVDGVIITLGTFHQSNPPPIVHVDSFAAVSGREVTLTTTAAENEVTFHAVLAPDGLDKEDLAGSNAISGWQSNTLGLRTYTGAGGSIANTVAGLFSGRYFVPFPADGDVRMAGAWTVEVVESYDYFDDEYVFYPEEGLYAMADDNVLLTFASDPLLPNEGERFLLVGFPDMGTRHATGPEWTSPEWPLSATAVGTDVYWLPSVGSLQVHHGMGFDAPVLATLPYNVGTNNGEIYPSIVWNEDDQALYIYGVVHQSFNPVSWVLIRVALDGSWSTVGSGPATGGTTVAPSFPVVTPDGAVWVPNVTFEDLPTWSGWGYIRYVPGGPAATVTPWPYHEYWGEYGPQTAGYNEYAFIPRPDNTVWFLDNWLDGEMYQLSADGSLRPVPLLSGLEYYSDFIAASPSAKTVALWSYDSVAGNELWYIFPCNARGRALAGPNVQRLDIIRKPVRI